MKKTAEELITEVLQALERRGNSQLCIDNYRYFWNSMARYFASVGCYDFNLDIAQEYLASRSAEQYAKRYGNFMKRGILMLDSYQRSGIILNRYYSVAHLLENKTYNELLNHYAKHLAEFNYSSSTIDNYLAHSATFLSYLEKSGLNDIVHMEAAHIFGYISTLQEYSTVTIKHTLGAVRLFLRYLYRNEYISHDLSAKIGRVNQTEHHKLPSFWTKDEVFALLNAIDRNNPSEKRDYAMVLLVARLGIRSGDLKKLKFEHLKWSSNTIEFVQSKNGVPISLPLLRDVGWAIIDYVENARPKVDSPYVFLTHLVPYGPLSERNHLYKTIEKYMARARLPIVQKRRNGMHSLRHSLATTLLQDNASLHMISDILGHTSSNSTAIYLQTDIERLRDCALSLKEDGNRMAEFNNFVFQSGFKEAIAGLIALKHGLGLKYYGPAVVLKRFDSFCTERYPEQTILSKELVSDWFSLCCIGKPKTTRLSMTPVSHLGTYLCNMGTSAYVFPVKTLPPDHRYTPHIYSMDELQRFFAATDDCRYTCAAPFRHHIMPVFFRLLYCCGLRSSEAISLKTGDVDLAHGVLTIRESKNGGERYVPMSEEMRLRCVSYWNAEHNGKQKYLYFFPLPPREKITYMNIYGNFRRFLRNAGISHGGRRNPIRIS